MSRRGLTATAHALVAEGRGLLAMDESTPTCNKRFAVVDIPQTVDARRAYRELLVTTPGLGDCISGAILYDETIRQQDSHGVLMVERLVAAGIIPGIKVDLGAKPLALHPGETVTEGLDGLRDRLKDYALLGARFAKWRGVIGIGQGFPSLACIKANAQALARYAALCQEAGLVPIVEPEVLMTGNHTLERCQIVTGDVLAAVFDELATQGVALDGLILKPNMVLPGLTSTVQVSADAVATATIACLLQHVPAEVAGIAFLSGGQSGELASARLNAMNIQAGYPRRDLPWPLVFSFARAIQQPALEIWRGDDANRHDAQEALQHRALCNQAALRGDYDALMEWQVGLNGVPVGPTSTMTAGLSSP
ncbi:fructose-bisphosphate aldolase class I (plasmid) [Lichenicola cladoniae]|uniref:Probable fructose-bisphosphate aldolase class 1 n=1 Tax=Lichenicola cladoniae TaxID=1484109 RepID=A0A6M8HYW0_9PROT|nr:class I fructose-bisphosphate aldolase [Lichenicola cladoniae]NPD66769.1 fructose-bisphosphate aldolase class I [Acetobacteraceae bacterium]QKE93530.1 fructose-bisphosphate aldolase class I [Lichenicola cladoniae]